MMEYLTIHQISKYLNIKTKTLYNLTASGDIPHYRIGRLIRFKQAEIDVWMEQRKVVKVNPDQTSKQILKSIRKQSINVDRLVKKTIDQFKDTGYVKKHGRPDHLKESKEEVDYGSL